MTEKHRKPKGLGYQGSKLWESLTAEYTFSAAELRILFDACRTADVIDQLDKAMVGEPLTVLGSARQKTINPLLAQAQSARALMATLLGKLQIPQESDDQKAAHISKVRAEAGRHRQGKVGILNVVRASDG